MPTHGDERLGGHERFFGVSRSTNARLRRVPMTATPLLALLGDALPTRVTVTDVSSLVKLFFDEICFYFSKFIFFGIQG